MLPTRLACQASTGIHPRPCGTTFLSRAVDTLKARHLLENATAYVRRACQPNSTSGATSDCCRSVYAGIDPTSSSLHVGHLALLSALKVFQDCGFRVIVLLGGATGRIGDPSGKSATRRMSKADTVSHNARAIRAQCLDLLPDAKIMDNNRWWSEMDTIKFMTETLAQFRLSPMLKKEYVRTRLEGQGMSLHEFCYPLLQAHDFYHLHQHHQVDIQVGGADQWGNIAVGVEYLHSHLPRAPVGGVTVPLILSSDGRKMGKSTTGVQIRQGNEYDVHQYFLRGTDSTDWIKRLFGIDEPDDRAAQVRLAAEVTRWVYGEAGLRKALAIKENLFERGHEEVDWARLSRLLRGSDRLVSVDAERLSVMGVIIQSGWAMNEGEAMKALKQGAVSWNRRPLSSSDAAMELGETGILGIGKKERWMVTFCPPV